MNFKKVIKKQSSLKNSRDVLNISSLTYFKDLCLKEILLLLLLALSMHNIDQIQLWSWSGLGCLDPGGPLKTSNFYQKKKKSSSVAEILEENCTQTPVNQVVNAPILQKKNSPVFLCDEWPECPNTKCVSWIDLLLTSPPRFCFRGSNFTLCPNDSYYTHRWLLERHKLLWVEPQILLLKQ